MGTIGAREGATGGLEPGAVVVMRSLKRAVRLSTLDIVCLYCVMYDALKTMLSLLLMLLTYVDGAT